MELTKLKEIRKMRKMSIKELSAITGIHRDRISFIERGIVNPSFKTVEAMAEALGVKIIISIS